MRFALLITAAPEQTAARDALRIAEALLDAGHELLRVFFAGAGVAHGNALVTPGRDEPDLCGEWQRLQRVHGLDLVVCVAAALHHGVLDADNAQRWDRPAASLADGFVISGLGQLADAQLQADRLLTFPA